MYGPPCLGLPGLCLDRWLDLDLLRSAGGVRPSATAAAEPDASLSRVGIGDALVALPRPAGLFVGLVYIQIDAKQVTNMVKMTSCILKGK